MQRNKKSLLACMLTTLMLGTGVAQAQQIEISSSLNPVGSGARATGMGGAFIGVADDATAASWNPAGLVQLEKPEFSLVYAYQNNSQKYNSGLHPELAGTENNWDIHSINYASVAYPFKAFNRNMIVSLNYQRLYELDKKLGFSYAWPLAAPDSLKDKVSYSQNGFLATISPAFAIQIIPELSFGATINIWDDFHGGSSWNSSYNSQGTGNLGGIGFNETITANNKYSFSGINANLGLMYSPTSKVNIGAVYKFAFDADLKRKGSFTQTQSFPEFPDFDTTTTDSTNNNMKMKMPASFGVGVSYKPTDNWVFALDTYYTEWSRFAIRDSAGNEVNPIYGTPISQGRLTDTVQVRVGGEYLFIMDKNVIPVRAGFFYDPEPAKGSMKDFFGFSLGSGFSTPRYSFDLSYQFRTASKATGDLPVDGINADITQHTVMSSMIFYFK